MQTTFQSYSFTEWWTTYINAYDYPLSIKTTSQLLFATFIPLDFFSASMKEKLWMLFHYHQIQMNNQTKGNSERRILIISFCSSNSLTNICVERILSKIKIIKM